MEELARKHPDIATEVEEEFKRTEKERAEKEEARAEEKTKKLKENPKKNTHRSLHQDSSKQTTTAKR